MLEGIPSRFGGRSMTLQGFLSWGRHFWMPRRESIPFGSLVSQAPTSERCLREVLFCFSL